MRRLAAALFALQFVILEICLRPGFAFVRDPRALAGLTASACGWALLASIPKKRFGRAILAIVAGVLFGGPALFHHYWHTPLDAQIVAAAAHNWPDVRAVLARMLVQIGVVTALASALDYALLTLQGQYTLSRKARIWAAITMIGGLIVAAPLRETTADLRVIDSLRLLAKPSSASAATNAALPRLPSTRSRLPNVLFVLTESVRASDACSAFSPDCVVMPEVNAFLPTRAPLHEMRAVASYTAVSLSALITGRSQEGSRAEIMRAPSLFEIVRAVRSNEARSNERGPTIAYWSAQSASVFESDVRGAIDSFITLETLIGHAVDDEDDVIDRGVDRLLANRFDTELPALKSPYFVLLHFAGTHAPYFVNEADAPFGPYTRDVAWSRMAQLHEAYRDSIHEQDKSIARSLRTFVAAQGDTPWLIVFTSDHGESFGEHGAIHHGQNLYDEQIHVPAFIAFGNGALDAEEEARLRSNAREHVTHLDLLPTILDAYGVRTSFAFAPYAAALRGRSLIANDRPREPLPITNCTEMFPCPVNTWGMVDGDRALEGQRWDAGWNCVWLDESKKSEPMSTANDAQCTALREASKRYFPRMPNGNANADASANANANANASH